MTNSAIKTAAIKTAAIKTIFFGTPQFAVPSLLQLLGDDRFDVIAVVTQPDRRRGRGNDLVPSPIKQVAVEHNLPVYQPDRIKRDEPTLTALANHNADAFAVVAYGQILSPQILAMPRLGCVNGHGSLLPAYRGAAPIQWSIVDGQRSTGVTTMLMDAGMDTGAMLLRSTMPIGLLDNADQVAQTMSELGAELLAETLVKLDRGEVSPTPQDNDQATYARLIQKADYGIDWSRSAWAIHNQVRGFYPNVATSLRGQALKVLGTIPAGDSRFELANWVLPAGAVVDAGTIVDVVKGVGPVVATGDGFLGLVMVQPIGKKPQGGMDLVNGLRVAIGEKLGG
jgi:methionyl-tRNA formyltransferase